MNIERVDDKDASPLRDSELRHRLSMFDLHSAPGHLLRRNHQRSYEVFARHMGDDVTRQQVALLIALAKRANASQRELVDATGIDKSTLKEMIGRLISRGWIERQRDPSDSRAWKMRITDAGQTLLLDKIVAVQAAQDEILRPLSLDDRQHLVRCLQILSGLRTELSG